MRKIAAIFVFWFEKQQPDQLGNHVKTSQMTITEKKQQTRAE